MGDKGGCDHGALGEALARFGEYCRDCGGDLVGAEWDALVPGHIHGPSRPSSPLRCGAEMLLHKVSLEKPAVHHPRAGGLRKQLQVPGKTSAGTSYLRVCITEGLEKKPPNPPLLPLAK